MFSHNHKLLLSSCDISLSWTSCNWGEENRFYLLTESVHSISFVHCQPSVWKRYIPCRKSNTYRIYDMTSFLRNWFDVVVIIRSMFTNTNCLQYYCQMPLTPASKVVDTCSKINKVTSPKKQQIILYNFSYKKNHYISMYLGIKLHWACNPFFFPKHICGQGWPYPWPNKPCMDG